MASAPVATLASVSKRYFRRPGLRSVAAELLGGDAPGSFWALRDVSLTVRRGESLGVVGVNGAGKTTLLRLLGGVTAPTCGERVLSGRVAALSEMQVCLHRELTGRENLPLLATLAGTSPRSVLARLEEILDFSGLAKELLDTPVKDYSTGMGARFAIAVAATGARDVIVVDEGIAGADAGFRRRCFERLRGLVSRGCAVVFASHDLSEIRRHCDRCLCLHAGRVAAEGSPDEVLLEYQRLQSSASADSGVPRGSSEEPPFSLQLRIKTPAVRSGRLGPDEPLEIELSYQVRTPVPGVVFSIEVATVDGRPVYLLRSPQGEGAWRLPLGPGRAVVRAARAGLAPGAYYVNAFALDPSLEHSLHSPAGVPLIVDGERDPREGPALAPEHEWTR